MKFLLIKFIIIAVLSTCCGADEITNTQPTSRNPGTLETFQISTYYPKRIISKVVEDKICLLGTDAEVCTNNKNNLETDFNFNLDQITNGSDVLAYTIEYNTPGVKDENRSVSGSVLIPQIPKDQIKGMVLYFHGTEISKYGIPSCLANSKKDPSYCDGHSSDSGEVLAGTLASQGYIVVMPDYIGMGVDRTVMHPYVLYPKVNAASGLNMVTATKSLLKRLDYQNIKQNFYITGFSEGGAYAIWASKSVQDTSNNFLTTNQLILKDTVGMSGAYDLVNAQLPMEINNVTLGDKYNIGDITITGEAKPILTAYLFSSYGFYNLDQIYFPLLVKSFLDCPQCLIKSKNYDVPDLFKAYDNPDINDVSIASYLKSAAATTSYSVSDNSARALIKNDILISQKFKDLLLADSTTTWTGGATPIGFAYLNKDSVVTNLNSTNMYTQVTNPDKTRIVVDATRYQYNDLLGNGLKPFDHVQSNVILLIAALQQFNQHL